MKHLVSLIILLFCLSVHAQNTTKVIIKQKGFGNKHQLRVVLGDLSVKTNEKGEVLFEKEIEINEPINGMIVSKSGRYTGFWLEPGKGEVIVNKKGFPRNTAVKGSKSHEVYQSLNYASDNNAFIKAFMENKGNPIALDVLNSKFKFKHFEQKELQNMYEAVAQKDKIRLPYVDAYLKTFGLDKVTLNDQIVDFEGEDQDGNTYTTSAYRGKYLLLDFAATGCGPCWAGYPDMVEEANKYENLQVLTYNEDFDIEMWNSMAKSRKIELPWPVLWNGENKLEVFERYNVEGWPLHFLISPEGKVLETWFGSGGHRLANNLKKHLK
jgi:peroxiredoxin